MTAIDFTAFKEKKQAEAEVEAIAELVFNAATRRTQKARCVHQSMSIISTLFYDILVELGCKESENALGCMGLALAKVITETKPQQDNEKKETNDAEGRQ
jgi:hypothetical protein